MMETLAPLEEPRRRFYFDWALPALFKPRKAFARITAQAGSLWLTPMLILTLTTLLLVGVSGWVKGQAAGTSANLPADYQYYTPEQQAQFQQISQVQQGPVFLYVFPALLGLGRIWLGWLIVGGMLHLVVTLLGGRGGASGAMNVVAWAALAFAVRDIVRIVAMLITHQAISSPGISGLAPIGGSGAVLFLGKLMAEIDLYVVWHILLIIVGVRAGSSLSSGKVTGGVILTVLLGLLLAALPGFIVASFSGLAMIRPFLF
jgi:hypothetical protein